MLARYLVIIPGAILMIAGMLSIALLLKHAPAIMPPEQKLDVFEQIQRKNDLIEQTASVFYQLGVLDVIQFWRFTGVVPNTPALEEALLKRRHPMKRGYSTPSLSAEEAQKILEESRDDVKQ